MTVRPTVAALARERRILAATKGSARGWWARRPRWTRTQLLAFAFLFWANGFLFGFFIVGRTP